MESPKVEDDGKVELLVVEPILKLKAACWVSVGVVVVPPALEGVAACRAMHKCHIELCQICTTFTEQRVLEIWQLNCS